ncbi:BTB/POZ domain-containing protein [Thalictrum thalictroides]|uniref:BTB/POZ domain-containing protein n=1 Tax=Thalictrum thalictroides TaxID=46969 RepID=A0A7J6WVF9_THATH|nr:BTB/POZ domain-containing protein [Thalictrum thalictroides]
MEEDSSSSSCNLEVDVNGEEVFFVNKEILLSFSGKLRKLFGKLSGKAKNLKLIFHDLPGGAKGFELMAKFCYNNGKAEINPSNIAVLHCVAFFMEMNQDISGAAQNLIEQTELSLKEISYWSWSELIEALKQCQSFSAGADSSGLLQKLLDSVVGRLVSTSDESVSTASPDSSGIRFSCDTRSTESFKNCYARTNWWFDDLVVLNPEWIEKVMKSMVSLKFDNGVISRFLLYYQKTRLSGVTLEVKCKIAETVIDLLSSLDHSSVPYKSLFGILRVTLGLNISKSCRNKLEGMIGSQLDQATMDNLLVPSPPGVNFLYDVNLVIRLLKSFLLGGTSWVSSIRLKKVAKIIDLYIAEVAPDPCLKSSKFVALVMALPDSARESYDEIYRSIDMYLEVHGGLSEEEKTIICSTLNYEKLSVEACKHLAQNSKFPATTAVQLLSSQQSKLKSLLQETSEPIFSSELSCTYSEIDNKGYKDKDFNHIVHYAKKLDLSTENEKLKENLQGMQWRVMELEKVCRKMQNQMAKIINSKASTTPSTPRSLPRMCS